MAENEVTLPNPSPKKASSHGEKEDLDIHVAFDGRLYVKPNDLLRSRKFREQVESMRKFRVEAAPDPQPAGS